MNSLKLLPLLLAAGITFLAVPQMCSAQAEPKTDTPADKLFSMALRLEESAPWKIQDVYKVVHIIGRKFVEDGYFSYKSYESDNPDDKLIRMVDIIKDPSSGLLTCVSLELPRQGLGISRALVQAKFGKYSYKDRKQIVGSMKLDGYRALVGWSYKRKNGGYLTFYFDDEKTKQLRGLDVTSP